MASAHSPQPPRPAERPPGLSTGHFGGIERGLRGGLALLFVLAFAGLVLRAAWLCDDAFITFRSVENLATGEGPRWNLAERVQAFTHPLWMLLLTAGRLLTGEIYGSALALSIALSVAAYTLVIRSGARTPSGALIAAVILIGSKAFVDYSTSGLEGPLVHLLVVLIVISYASASGPGRALQLSGATALLLSTRPDALPLVGPIVAAGLFTERRHVGAIAAGATPLIAWLAFSTWYYGFPFPNTAYAKLSSGLPREWLFEQGLFYLLNSFKYDPLTMISIALGLGIAVWKRERASLLLAAGLLLQLAFVVWVGGDFMSGRFLTAPLLVAALILSRSATLATEAIPLSIFLGVLSLATPRSPLMAPTHYGALLDGSAPHDHIDERGITDERAYWFHYTGLFSPSRRGGTHALNGHPFAEQLKSQGPGLHVVAGMGFIGYFSGPVPHLLDPMGLTDPLLARLPVWYDGSLRTPQDLPEHVVIPWRIGHFVRPLPAGYQDTLESGENRLSSPALAEYWNALELITRAPLSSPGRWSAIWRINTGQFDDRIADYLRTESPVGETPPIGETGQ